MAKKKRMHLESEVPQGECPKCGGDAPHGECPKCGYCGCSWDPTSFNDYCDKHKPK